MENLLSRYLDIQKKLNSLRLDGLEDYKIGYTLSYSITHILFSNVNSCWRLMLSIIKNIFVNKNDFEIEKNNSDFLFFVTHVYITRNDHKKTMRLIAETAGDVDMVMPIERYKFNFNFSKIKRIIKWNNSLKQIDIKSNQRLYLLYEILAVWNYLDEVKKNVDIKDYKCLVVRMDAQVVDNIIVQYAKLNGLKTVTAQDGFEIKASASPKNLIEMKVNLRGSVSDYCLSWSSYFAGIIKQVVCSNQIVEPVGMPKYIEDFKREEKYSNGAFGVLIDFHDEMDSNDELIRIANAISKRLNKPYILRYHPRQRDGMYDAKVAENCKTEQAPNQTNFVEFVQKCSFVIGCNSSTVFESAYLNRYTYRFLPVPEKDYFRACQYPLQFSTEEELYNFISDNSKVDDVYVNEVCGPQDVRRCYEDFFKSIKNG